MTAIENHAFANCVSLKTAVIPKSVTKIDWDAFNACPNLTIHAPVGSEAEKFAKNPLHTIPFQAK